jgi:hypothetical protein
MPNISERSATAVLAIAVALFSIYLLWLTTGFPHGEGAPGPAVWPRVVLVMTLIASVYLTVTSLFGDGGDDEKKIITQRLLLPGIVMVLTIAYLIAMQWAFFASTIVFLFVCMSILRVRSWPVRIGVSLGFPLVVYAVFVRLLHLTFPSLLNLIGG